MNTTNAQKLAEDLMWQHGLKNWRFVWISGVSRAGVCKYRQQHIGVNIDYARLNDEAAIKDTILHEIAHALAGSAAGHGPVWKMTARRIGCSGNRCVSGNEKMPDKRYKYSCKNTAKCSTTGTAQKLTHGLTHGWCSRCERMYGERHGFNVTDTQTGRNVYTYEPPTKEESLKIQQRNRELQAADPLLTLMGGMFGTRRRRRRRLF